jgi:hypothetical protein
VNFGQRLSMCQLMVDPDYFLLVEMVRENTVKLIHKRSLLELRT